MHNYTNLLYRYSQGIIGLNKDDVIFTSFPKSGNTWVRFFFCNLISLNEWEGRIVDFSTLDQTMPALGVSNLLQKWEYHTIPRIVKTHKAFWPVFNNKKAILLVRDPKDAMVSFYKFETSRRKPRFKGHFSEFIRTKKFGLNAWAKHYNSWINKAGLVLFYEELKQSEQKEFKKIINYLDINIDEDLFLKAIENANVKKVKKVEVKFGLSKKTEFKKGYNFANKGGRGNWKDFFRQEDIVYYKEVMQKNSIDIYPI